MDIESAAFRATNFIERDIEIDRQVDGTIVMKSRIPLRMRETSLLAYLRVQACNKPASPWLHQRKKGGESGWRSINFGDALDSVNRLTKSLLDLNLSPGQSLAIISENSIEHALISLASMQASIPVVPMSSVFYLKAGTPNNLVERLVAANVGAIFVESSVESSLALSQIDPAIPVISVDGQRPGCNDLLYAELARVSYGEEVEHAFRSIDPDAPTRFMFTSGSTGSPKPAIHTQRNIVAAIESNLMTNGFQQDGNVVRLDWMPWNHVVGTSVLGITLVSGGAFYIDEGRPVGDLFKKTIENLKDVSPTVYFSMPAGYVMLVDALEADEALGRNFFKNLKYMSFSGASLPDDVARRMQILAVRFTGFKIPFTCGYGSTETGPGGMMVYWPSVRAGLIGLPQPGYDIKLIPIEDGRYAIWIKGLGVTPGYLGMPELNDEMFDAEGFIKMGDAASFVDPNVIDEGLAFAGRLSEQFKLQTGTFVLGSSLHGKLMDRLAPVVQDLVICGADRAYVAILIWLNFEAARSLLALPAASDEELIQNPAVSIHISSLLREHNRFNPGSSTRIERFHILRDGPSFENGEVNDKKTINSNAVQRLRPSIVEMLYENEISSEVHVVNNIKGKNDA